MADLVCNALRMSLLKDLDMRKGICVKQLSAQLKRAFKVAQRCLSDLKPKMIDVPKALKVPRNLIVDLDKPAETKKLPK
jgi:hypothetical protein